MIHYVCVSFSLSGAKSSIAAQVTVSILVTSKPARKRERERERAEHEEEEQEEVVLVVAMVPELYVCFVAKHTQRAASS